MFRLTYAWMKIPLVVSAVSLLPMFLPLPPTLDSKLNFTVLAMKTLMNLLRTEFRKRLTTLFTALCYMPLKNNLCTSLHILLFINLSHFTIVSKFSLNTLTNEK